MIRKIDIGSLSARGQTGLAYLEKSRRFLVLDQRPSRLPSGELEISAFTPRGDRVRSRALPFSVMNPVNTAFDSYSDRLLILDSNLWRFLVIQTNNEGDLEPETLSAVNIVHLTLNDPQGITTDPDGRVYILDIWPPRIIQAEFLTDHSVSIRSVSPLNLGITSDLRGLAFDSKLGHLFIVQTRTRKLLELTTEGEFVTAYDLSGVLSGHPQGLTFAPSGDMTDDPSEMNLYIVEKPNGSSSSLNQGQITEMSLSPMAEPLAASTVIADLVQTVHTYLFSPPSPDPAGITYYPPGSSLFITDCEVEEMGIFEGANVFEINPAGVLLRAAAATSFSDEPTGIAYNPATGHLLISDDDAERIYDLDPGADGMPFTADDGITSFSVGSTGSGDAEDVAYDSWRGVLYWVDGLNNEVYRDDPGLNGIFDGPPPAGDDQVTHFDTSNLGVMDPEGISFNTDNGNLFIVGVNPSVVAETDTYGNLLRIIDASATQANKPAGLGYAPSSVLPGTMNLYMVARGVDNNERASENDGELYELAFPPLTAGNLPPVVDAGPDQTIRLPASAALAGTASDDGLPDPPGTITAIWRQIEGLGTATFADEGALDTTVSFSSTGVYSLLLTVSDGELLSSDMVVVAVENTDGYMPIEIRVAGSADDGEESASGTVSLYSSDLELVNDGNNQTVGLRFNNVGIPKDATIGSAYIQFKTDETSSEVTTLNIQGEAADNAATFSAASFNISFRPRTAATASWSPPAWTTVGAAGAAQRTTDLASIIQEIVNRPGWTKGSSLAIIVTGSGRRVAEAYNGDQAGAPLLHVEYGTGPEPIHDVAVTALTAPTPVTEGQAQTVSVTVENQGTSEETFEVNLADDLGATVGSPQTVSGLAAGESRTLSFDWTPTETGTHTLAATAETVSGETETEDNFGTVTVTVDPVPPHDVAVTAVTAPTPVTVGQAQTVSVTVENQGTSEETFEVSLADDLGATVGSPQTVSGLAAGASTTLSFGWTPTETGTHTLTATAEPVAGETDIADNVGTTTSAVNPVPVHDVAVTAVTAPTPVTVGQAQTVAVTVANQGTSAETFPVSLADSLGATVGSPQTVSGLAAGASTTLSFGWTPTETGTHTLTATAEPVAGETDIADNVGTTTSVVNPVPVHDVAVTGLTAPTPVMVGQAQTVAVTVANQGTSAETFPVSLADSLGATVGSPQTVTNLAAGASTTLSFGWTPTETGTHTLTATAEPVAGETDIADNVGTTTSVVNPVPVHDVAVTAVAAPSPVTVGQAQTVAVTVANQGTFSETFAVSLADDLGANVGSPQTVSGLAAGASTTLSFGWTPTETGTHTLTATAEPVGGEIETEDNVGTATAVVSTGLDSLDIRIAASGDDGEESLSGSVNITSSDLELVEDGGIQTVGLRFNSVTIPKNATIGNAHIQFKADETSTVATSLNIQGQAADNAAIFSTTAFNISSRPRTTAAVSWSPPAWPTIGEAGANQRTPNLAPVIQEIVNRPGWVSGSALAVIVTGTGERVAESFNGDQAGAPLLHVEYTFSTTPVHDVAVTAVTVPTPVTVGQAQTVTVTVANQGTFVETFEVSLADDLEAATGPPQTVSGLAAAASTTLIFGWTPTETGTHTLTATAEAVGGEIDTSDNVGSTAALVTDGLFPIEVRIDGRTDDAEEDPLGRIDINSSDLELVEDDSLQTVGLRFNNVGIPKNATIATAYIQFKVDEISSRATTLNIQGEAADNAATFSSTAFGISSRPRTVAMVIWSPEAWATVGEQGAAQRTTDLAPIIQEIVNRPGWSNGTSLAIIVTGTGTRIAESYNGDREGAPLLHVEYTLEGAQTGFSLESNGEMQRAGGRDPS